MLTVSSKEGKVMRIGTYNMVNQVYSTSTAKKSTTADGTGYASFKDQISLSTAGKDMQVAKNALAKTPDVREDKVNDIKSRLENESYNVDPEAFASKLMSAFAERNLI
jgi:negative regulator of flagellin synthesis FlgM